PSDAQLVALRPRLRRLVGYRSFQVVRQERRRCSWQNVEAFKIPGGRLLHVVPKGMRDQTVMMQVKLLDRHRALVDTDVRLQNRGVMLFGVARNAPEVGGALIIMLRAEDCWRPGWRRSRRRSGRWSDGRCGARACSRSCGRSRPTTVRTSSPPPSRSAR